MSLPGEEARQMTALLKFDENSAGGMMNTEFVFVGETATRAEAVAWVRSKEVKLDQLDSIILIDGDAKFSGRSSGGAAAAGAGRAADGGAEIRAAGFGAARRR